MIFRKLQTIVDAFQEMIRTHTEPDVLIVNYSTPDDDTVHHLIWGNVTLNMRALAETVIRAERARPGSIHKLLEEMKGELDQRTAH